MIYEDELQSLKKGANNTRAFHKRYAQSEKHNHEMLQ